MNRLSLLLVAVLFLAGCATVPVLVPSPAPNAVPVPTVPSARSDLETALRSALARGETQLNHVWKEPRDLTAEMARLNGLLTDPSVPGTLYLASWQWRTQSSGRNATVSATLRYRTGAATPAAMAAVDTVVDQVVASLKPGQSEYQIELALHDWLVTHARYNDDAYRSGTVPGDEYTPYGVLVKGTGVCESYASAFYLLARRAGLAVTMVSGEAGGGSHSWNQVRIDGRWYHLDATWDDPVGVEERLSHDYFNLTDADLADRVWDRASTEPATATAAQWHVRAGLTSASLASFQTDVAAALTARSAAFERRIMSFRRPTFENDVAAALKQAASRSKTSAGWSYSVNPDLGIVSVTFRYR